MRQSADVIVIGAGAAGMLAAAESARRGADVLLLEKNTKTGVKILMSGGTRCNITQDTDARGIVAAFGKSGRFLQKSVGAFGPSDVVQMFHDAGVATKVESTGKVFPRSDRAIHVRDALERMAIESGVRIHLRTSVTGIQSVDDQWSVSTTESTFHCHRVIITSGGKSWPGCGTTGDAYRWLQELGHTIVRTRPALVPLVGGAKWSRDLSGLTLEDCRASVFQRKELATGPVRKAKTIIDRRGGFLFTHFGFSGPVAMDISGTMTKANSFEDVQMVVDLLPGLTEPEIRSSCTDRHDGGRRKVVSVLSQWLPTRLADALVKVNQCDTSIAELPGSRLDQLIGGLKRLSLPVEGTRGFAKAEVTAGGVKLSEIDARTMESKIQPGLYIAGEVLDVDGWIGGYNFQAAFSTGRAAGIAASESLH